MNNLEEAKKEFIAAMSYVPSSQEDINATLQKCMGLLPNSAKEEVVTFMKDVFKLTSLSDQRLSALASNICGYLVEIGYPSTVILDELIEFVNDALDKSHIFFEVMSASAANIAQDVEDRNEKIDELYSNLLNDPDIVDDDTFRAISNINEHYTAAISVFAIDKNNLIKGKSVLGKKIAFAAPYSQGCYWINLLFKTLFDEPIIVIDLDNNKGFRGKMNGVVDNYQLHHLLMGIPFLNPTLAINEEDLAVANGSGKQIEDRSIDCKWNLYNLELCCEDNWREVLDDSSKSIDFRYSWIWSEGEPTSISIHNGYRVILLGEPSYVRSSKVQRTFKNLKASIDIEKELSPTEINEWLTFFGK